TSPQAAGILPWMVIDTTGTGTGGSFAVYNASNGSTNTNGLQSLGSNNVTPGLPSAGTANGTGDINVGGFTGGFSGLTLTNSVGFQQITGVNSLTINSQSASPNAITIADKAAISIDSGGILVSAPGSTTIASTGSGSINANGTRELIIWTTSP